MNPEPRTIRELKVWLQNRGADSRQFAVEWEPEWEGYLVREGPPYWTLNVKGWPAESTVVRCDTEAEVCECYVELVNGTYLNEGSTTRRIRDEVKRRVERSWQIDETEEQQP